MTLYEQLKILQAAKRGEKIERKLHFSEANPWTPVPASIPHAFDFSNYVYRIADPYAELKAAAIDPTKQIRITYGDGSFGQWFDFGFGWCWTNPPKDYEIRDKPKKVVKYLCWERCGELRWRAEGTVELESYWYRRPAFDKECEVEE